VSPPHPVPGNVGVKRSVPNVPSLGTFVRNGERVPGRKGRGGSGVPVDRVGSSQPRSAPWGPSARGRKAF
jgi:hypothetical protein